MPKTLCYRCFQPLCRVKLRMDELKTIKQKRQRKRQLLGKLGGLSLFLLC